jgi:hypothetical protein
MAKLLAGVTHALVTIASAQDAKTTGTTATVSLCFGPGDDTSIGGLCYTKVEGQKAWHVPQFQVFRDGKPVILPVFKGDLLVEVCKLASAALARIRKDCGAPQWGRQYAVYKDRVELKELNTESQEETNGKS